MKVSSTNTVNNGGWAKPKNDRADVLLTLIKNGKVSLEDFPTLAGFRTRASELQKKHNLKLETERVSGVNRRGHSMTFHRHILPESEYEFAVDLYKKINN